MYGILAIEAHDLDHAISQALSYSRGGGGLPEAYLIDDSFTIDYDDIECFGDTNNG